MGGNKRLGLHKGASQKKSTHTHTNLLLNYNKQIQKGHYNNNTEHNKHSHAPKQITQHQKKNILQQDEKHYDLSKIKLIS